jgi:hypothetical protein
VVFQHQTKLASEGTWQPPETFPPELPDYMQSSKLFAIPLKNN